jgi:mannose-6-phosphate isomerase-like protein (cupin superfamily)
VNEGDETRAYLLQPSEGRPIDDGVAPAWFKAGAAETGGAFNFHYSEGRSGGPGTPLHIHHRDDECVLLLEGEGIAICGSRQFRLTPGCFLYLPRGVPHAIRYLTATKRVAIVAPGVGWERISLHMQAARIEGRAPDEVFSSLPPDAHVEYLAPLDWGAVDVELRPT